MWSCMIHKASLHTFASHEPLLPWKLWKGLLHIYRLFCKESIIIIFKSYLNQRNFSKTTTDFLLIGQRGKLKSVNSIETILKVITKNSGLQKRIYPHLLRHSIATHLLKNGMPLEKVSQFLGHKSIGSTQRYTHIWVLKLESQKL